MDLVLVVLDRISNSGTVLALIFNVSAARRAAVGVRTAW